MTAPIVNKSSTPAQVLPSSYPTSFYRNRFKLLHVVAWTTYDIIAYLACKIAKIGCSILFFKNQSYQFQQLSSYFYRRMSYRIIISISNEKIINFSVNCASHPKPFINNNSQELTTLKTLYGPLLERRLHAEGNRDNPLPLNQLKCLNMDGDGVCFGSSLDFASRFLSENLPNSDHLKTVEHISSLFVNSATLEGELSQIILNSTHNDPSELVNDNIAKKFLHDCETIASEVANDKKITVSLFSKAIQKYTCDEIQRRLYLYISRIFNIDLKSIQRISIETDAEAEEAQKKMLTQFDLLRPGVYQLHGFFQDIQYGHVMNYIKESNERAYLFNPGVGTFLVTNHNELLADSYLVFPRIKSLHILRCKKKNVIDETSSFKRLIFKNLGLSKKS